MAETFVNLMVLRMGAHRRSVVEILCNILQICLKGETKTNIVYKANLNFTRLNKYLNVLLSMGFISLSVVYREGDSNAMQAVYKTSEHGKNFLANFMKVWEELAIRVKRSKAKPFTWQF